MTDWQKLASVRICRVTKPVLVGMILTHIDEVAERLQEVRCSRFEYSRRTRAQMYIALFRLCILLEKKQPESRCHFRERWYWFSWKALHYIKQHGIDKIVVLRNCQLIFNESRRLFQNGEHLAKNLPF
jgi:hypothetical protein